MYMVAGYAVGLLLANMAVYVMAMGQVRRYIRESYTETELNWRFETTLSQRKRVVSSAWLRVYAVELLNADMVVYVVAIGIVAASYNHTLCMFSSLLPIPTRRKWGFWSVLGVLV